MADELWINAPVEINVELEEVKGEDIGEDTSNRRDVTSSVQGEIEKSAVGEKPAFDKNGNDSNYHSEQAANSWFSSSDIALVEFEPTPYIFHLADAFGQKVTLAKDRLLNARVICPPYHILLDHLLAVIWCFYSKKRFDLLESSQIHWALKFLQGTRDHQGLHTADVQMAINHLKDAYIDVCSRYNVSKLKERNCRQSYGSSHRLYETEIKRDLFGFSIHLADMVSNEDPEIMRELLRTEFQEKDINNFGTHFNRFVVESEKKGGREQYENLVALRNDKLRVALEKIAELRVFDEINK